MQWARVGLEANEKGIIQGREQVSESRRHEECISDEARTGGKSEDLEGAKNEVLTILKILFYSCSRKTIRKRRGILERGRSICPIPLRWSDGALIS